MNDQVNNKPPGNSYLGRAGKTLLLFVVGAYILLALIGAVLSLPDSRCKADALVLLSGGDMARSEEVARLFEKGCSQKVILTLASGTGNGNHLNTLKDLVKLGVPSGAVLFTSVPSDSTYDEARHVLELMKVNNMGDAIVVTDPYHVFRARLIFRGEFRKSGESVWVRSARGHWYKALTWMFRIEGWELTIKELGKISAYFLGVKGS